MKSTNGSFYKSAKHWTSNTRVLDDGTVEVYDSIEAEYRAVERLHSLTDYFVEPYELDYESSGEPSGYFMEDLEGQPLEWYLNPERSGRPEEINLERVGDQLEDFMETISQAEEPHGDLNPGNIMVHDDSSITVFDPVGYPEDFEWSGGELRKDRQNVDETVQRLEQLQDRKISTGPGNRTEFKF